MTLMVRQGLLVDTCGASGSLCVPPMSAVGVFLPLNYGEGHLAAMAAGFPFLRGLPTSLLCDHSANGLAGSHDPLWT